MPRTFAIIENGVVANVILAEKWSSGIDVTDAKPRPGPGWKYDGESFAPPESSEPVVETTPRMTQYGFLTRLTLAEHVAIEDAMPASTLLRVAKQRFDASQNVDVSLPETQQFVGLLAQMGLVAPERVPELLAPAALDSPHALP